MDFRSKKTIHRLASTYAPIILILVVAAALRINNITQPFTDDNAWRESSVAMMAQNFYQKSWNIFYPEVNWVGPGPGYQGREFQAVSYITALLYTLFGQHDWIGRGVVVTFALFGIFALYQLVRHVWDEQRAIATAAIMAILAGVVRLERSFLPDPVMVALIVTSFWMLVLYLQTDKLHYLLLAMVIGVLGALTKIPGMIVGLPMFYTSVFILGRKQALQSGRVERLAIAGVISVLPVAAYYLWARHLSQLYPPHHFAGEGNWLWDYGLRQWINESFFLSRLWGPLTRLWSLPGILLLCIGLLIPLFKRREPEEGSTEKREGYFSKAPWLFHWWMLGGLIFYFAGALELIENPSNLHILSPAVAAILSNAIFVMSAAAAAQIRRPGLIKVIAGSLIVFLGIWGLRHSRLHSSYAEESYELGQSLRSVSRNDDVVVTLGNLIGCPVAIYYSGRRGWLFPPFEEIKDWNELPQDKEAIDAFERLRASGAKWFGIVSSRNNEIWNARTGFARHIDRTCELIRTNGDAIVYRILTEEEIRQ